MISSARVALDALGPAFQFAIVPVGVEHEDRVVAHALDEQAEARSVSS